MALMHGGFINNFQYARPEMFGSQDNFQKHTEIT